MPLTFLPKHAAGPARVPIIPAAVIFEADNAELLPIPLIVIRPLFSSEPDMFISAGCRSWNVETTEDVCTISVVIPEISSER
jgi:hypothetical protein